MLIASCAPSVKPSLAALPGTCAITLRSNPGSIPERSRIFSTTPTLTGADIDLSRDAGSTESKPALTDPNNAATPGSS